MDETALDIAHVNGASDDVTVHLNFGGTFVRRSYAAALASYDVALGLLDGDDRGDLVVAADGGIAYLRGDAVTGGFTSAEFVPVEGALRLTGVAAGDFNGDGLDDVAGVSRRGPPSSSTTRSSRSSQARRSAPARTAAPSSRAISTATASTISR
jgi:hypothetical protein